MISTLRNAITSFGWNTRLLRCAALSLLLYRAVIAAAQDDRPDIEPLYSYQFVGLDAEQYNYKYEYAWTSDNTLVISDQIRDLEMRDDREVWTWMPATIVYNPDGPNASQTLLSPSSLEPLPSHVQMLPPTFNTPFATSPDGRIDLYTVDYRSPNENYVPGPIYHALGIVDRTTGVVEVLTDIRIGRVAETRWSADSNAFVMRVYGGYGDVYYIYVNQLADVTQARGIMLSDFDGVFANALQWSIYQAYDLDSTGRYLLADGYLYSPEFDPGNMRLLVIDMQTLTYEVVSSKGYFNGAGFQKPDEQQVLYMSVDGVFAYDRQTKTSVLLTDGINAAQTPTGDFKRFHPDFSPDGRYLAAQLNIEEDRSAIVHVYPIPPILDEE